MQNVRHQHRVIRSAKRVSVEISGLQMNPSLKSRFFHHPLGRPEGFRKIKDRRDQIRIGSAKGHGMRSSPASEIQQRSRTAEIHLFGEAWGVLQRHAMQDHQHIFSQARIGSKEVLLHGGFARQNRAFQLSPICPFRILQQQEMPGI